MTWRIEPTDSRTTGWLKLLTAGTVYYVARLVLYALFYAVILPFGMVWVCGGMLLDLVRELWDECLAVYELVRDDIDYIERKR